MIAPIWNEEFQLPDGSYTVSDIQNYIEFIIKKRDTLTKIPLLHIFINIINNGLVFKIKIDISSNYKRLEQRNCLAAQKN